MRIPEFLKENGTIGFVAPSYGCNIEPYKSAFDHAQDIFKQRGYRLLFGPNCYEGKGIGISNEPKLCGAELNLSLIHILGKKDYDKAIEILTQALEYDDTNVDAMYFLGRCYQQKSDEDKAKEYYNKIINDYSTSARVGEAKRRLRELGE